jgi:hypothetical protein
VKDCYRIKDYDPNLTFNVSGCTSNTSSEPPWDGSLENDDPSICTWYGNLGGSPSIQERQVSNLLLRAHPVECWILEIQLTYSHGPSPMLWRGTKSSGSTPAGVYTRTGGCSTGPETLEIEECPGADYAQSFAPCYQIADYVDGDFDLTGCADCSDSEADAWDGTFSLFQPDDIPCTWAIDKDTWQFGSISGKRIAVYGDINSDEATGTISGCPPVVAIWCYNEDTQTPVVVWQGQRTANHPDYPDDPVAGTYSGLGGCDTTTTSLIIEPCP